MRSYARLLEEIRRGHPNPSRWPQSTVGVGGYSVGGSLLMHTTPPHPEPCYPTVRQLSVRLHELRPDVSYDLQLDQASGIITANDAGDFDRAWSLLAAALGVHEE